MRDDLPELRDTVAELRELCDRYGFAYYREWGLILDGWSRAGGPGIEPRPAGHRQPQGGRARFARMPYWLSLLADLLARTAGPATARATLDAALAAGRHTGRRVVAARGDADARRLRRRSRRPSRGCAPRPQMAAAHGSVALLRRCERDLAAARRSCSARPAFSPRPDASAARERCANGRCPSVFVTAT